ncbi:beta transducin [Fusarium longipes]|uniref:Beta transducin n=1 Tax=Fusarium longipes TaxID=694270 RepID=A0A395RYC3_9HYPO|nr:beta transducin [Fusarium longipes]
MVLFRDIQASNALINDDTAPRIAVFVGGTSGIGKSTLHALVARGTSIRVYLVGRKSAQERTETFIQEAHTMNTKAEIIWIEGEVSLLADTKRVCEVIKSRENHIDLLFLSTGYAPFTARKDTIEGFEISQTLRYYSRMLFILHLLPLLDAAESPRVISVLAGGMERSAIQLDDIDLKEPGNFNVVKAHTQAADMNTLFLEYLANKHLNVTFIHSCPGWVNTGNVRRGLDPNSIMAWVIWLLLEPLIAILSFSDEESSQRYLFQSTSAAFGGRGTTWTKETAVNSRGKQENGLFLVTNIRRKKGFKKIQLCAEQAKRDDLQYCWVDTCCIDKSSSAELSEAINSMFTWYRNSTVCYIYLEDVVHLEGSNGRDHSFQNARWFTRGWTLQELVAPRVRHFYDVNWTRIGSISESQYNQHFVNGFLRDPSGVEKHLSPHLPERSNIPGQVSQITGIPDQVFYSGDLTSFSIATRMSWASRRETTRIEDQAYCLLGIFNVQMPLLYGEGSKAFIRLQEEIIKRQPDHTLFAWRSEPHSPTPTFSGLLAPSPKNFCSHYCQGLSSKHVEMPYEMTNKGLHLQVRLIKSQRGPDEFYAILDVSHTSNPRKDIWYGIKLGRLNQEGQFARINADEHMITEAETADTLYIRPSHIYVQNHINQESPLYGRQRPSRVILGCALGTMLLTVLESSGSKSWDDKSFSFCPSQDDLFYAKLSFENTPKLRNTPFFTMGWIVSKDDIEGMTSRLAILSEPKDLHKPETLWESGILSGTVKIYAEKTFSIINGEMVARIVLRDQFVQ